MLSSNSLQVQQLKTEAASSGAEVSALREALGLARDEAAAKAQENTKAQTALQEVRSWQKEDKQDSVYVACSCRPV